MKLTWINFTSGSGGFTVRRGWHGEYWFEVRHGITRTCFVIGPWAIKIPSVHTHGEGLRGFLWSFARGVLANQCENDFSYSPGVCPVRYSLLGGLINVYPRALTIAPNTIVDYDAIDFTGPTDPKPYNVGILNEQLVWLDYDQNWNDRPPCQHVATT